MSIFPIIRTELLVASTYVMTSSLDADCFGQSGL